MTPLNGFVRTLIVVVAGVAVFWTSPREVEACGAKLSAKGSKFHHARMAKASSASRQPIATGPIDTRARTAKATGGVEGRAAVGAGGGETRRSRPPGERPRRPKPVAQATPVEQPTSDPVGGVDKRPGEDTEKAPDTTDEPATRPEEPSEPREPKAKGKLPKMVFFGNARAGLTPATKASLDRAARWLKQNPDRSITVEGHASTQGNAAANQTLSERRAEVVKEYLVGKGIDESRITTVGHGSEKPEFEPGTSAKNRRVVIVAN